MGLVCTRHAKEAEWTGEGMTENKDRGFSPFLPLLYYLNLFFGKDFILIHLLCF